MGAFALNPRRHDLPPPTLDAQTLTESRQEGGESFAKRAQSICNEMKNGSKQRNARWRAGLIAAPSDQWILGVAAELDRIEPVNWTRVSGPLHAGWSAEWWPRLHDTA